MTAVVRRSNLFDSDHCFSVFFIAAVFPNKHFFVVVDSSTTAFKKLFYSLVAGEYFFYNLVFMCVYFPETANKRCSFNNASIYAVHLSNKQTT